jgi:hypothetical protein
VPAFAAFNKPRTPSFNQRNGLCEAGTRKISKPITSCRATPQAIVFQAIFLRFVESNHAMPRKVKKPDADIK